VLAPEIYAASNEVEAHGARRIEASGHPNLSCRGAKGLRAVRSV
jgi:hypothetical protein